MNVTRNLVLDVMFDVDQSYWKAVVRIAKSQKRKVILQVKELVGYICLDGHVMLMGYHNSTFPLTVYGANDTASRKILRLKIGVSNSNPKVMGRWYLEY